MFEWLNLSAIGNSIVGSLIVGLLFLSTSPIWWKWVKPENTTKLKDTLSKILFLCVLLGVLLLLGVFQWYIDEKSIPRYHPTLSSEEASLVLNECEMQSITATSDIQSSASRTTARQEYRKNCLLSKGFKWTIPENAK